MVLLMALLPTLRAEPFPHAQGLVATDSVGVHLHYELSIEIGHSRLVA